MKSTHSFTFARSSDGWVFLSAVCNGKGRAHLILDDMQDIVFARETGDAPGEAMRYLTKGKHAFCGYGALLDHYASRQGGRYS